MVSLGLRAESQTLPKDKLRFAPRLSIAYSPDKKQNWAIRARAGVFYERIGDVLSLESERLDGINQQRILIDDPTFPNPFLGGQTVDLITVRRVLDSNLKASRFSANACRITTKIATRLERFDKLQLDEKLESIAFEKYKCTDHLGGKSRPAKCSKTIWNSRKHSAI